MQTQDTHKQPENDLNGSSVADLKRDFLNKLFYVQGKFPALASLNDYYMALSYTVRDRLLERWINTAAIYTDSGARTICYLSAEFLMGPQLGNNLINLGIYDQAQQAVEELGLDLDALLEQEEEPGLGNGGLGRLAACYLDSMATLEIPSIGYGIRYEFGIFEQDIRDGWQVERTDKWLRFGNPWEISRPEWAVEVKLGGHVDHYTDEQGRYRVRWIPYEVVKGVPYDNPILGYKTNTANTLRLWTAEAPESFDFAAFNSGNYAGAVHKKMVSENVSKVLYPNDDSDRGKRLRLTQQIFFVSCSLQDTIRIMQVQDLPLAKFHEKFVIQLNDTHPAISIAELMRLLVDEHYMKWDQAWAITQRTFAYTNHTILPEALERWPIALFSSLLPRHMEIIYEINHHFIDDVRMKFPDDPDRIARMSLIDESGEKYVRMAHLACVGSHAINGVAALHTELLQQDVLSDFYALYPHKFSNKTNGVTPRRFVVLSNPRLTDLISSKIGNGWIKHLDELKKLEAYVDDIEFQQEWQDIKYNLKRDLANQIVKDYGINVDPHSLFDIQAKRIHEYKRQHLNVLHIITLYNRIKANPDIDITPQTFLFGGKAAPGYFMAKLIIKLINSVADVVNRDPDVRDRIKVVFLKDYSVKFAQHVYPAADLSEQISTAGKEASGTGNMKFAMNGALTIGTLDGANIEIREEVGAENFFLFGLTEQEVQKMSADGYSPIDYYHTNLELKLAIDRIASGFFSHGDPELFKPLLHTLFDRDPYFLFADYQAYIDCQHQASLVYRDLERWTRMSILNVARMGKFSSDRSIREYCEDIWHIKPVKVELNTSMPDNLSLKH
ncbi:glycogen/starch/alpha-glucan phosphorylase [Chamaesiphon minutus]|uniref:Alpha-1,4 glucan phosphorylase n=1 Tax=Chamaesiphon minutus (strain ATCC 27169 / PCC 6605) TaxID=1173020 RepID=K9UB91_CHAP6|nr:glycogen/starch/alpha-glucan phosphorylase [Chamaesiphon minutus]AFY91888.1 glycogen/starch/alpha-glucan phosphorylase [Chamaesiphon minutus PCC 6605]